MSFTEPTWEDDIGPLFAAPFWVPEADRDGIAAGWQTCMTGFGIDLHDYASVAGCAVTIHDHLASRAMPLTTDQGQFWPFKALDRLRLWTNQGCRRSASDPIDVAERIPVPTPAPDGLRIRRDLRAMPARDIDAFRARLDDVMRVADSDPQSPWQRFADMHANWCLHYQEAFAFWHRAYLLYLEELIGMPVPYWDWMAADASVEGSAGAGVPQPFLDETYVHPATGEVRRNPLRYAAARGGVSKLCAALPQPQGVDCRYVQRNPLIYATAPSPERSDWMAMLALFQQQVITALAFESFSQPQGDPGYPWANLPSFVPPQPDHLYPNRALNFDGLYEQAHDNFHGWIGPDMADNAYTSYDPIFLCFHANIDRMLEVWLRAHPAAQFTAQTALQPFIGPAALAVDPASPDRWRYTSIGALAQDSRHIGYDYGPPVALQFTGRTVAVAADTVSQSDGSGGVGLTPWIVFDDVRCTQDSYQIDVFLDQPAATLADAVARNPHYVGRFSRIGMGIADDKGRCVRTGVSRALDARRAALALELSPDRPVVLTAVVTELPGRRPLDQVELSGLSGFRPSLVWGDPRQPGPPDSRHRTGHAKGPEPCH